MTAPKIVSLMTAASSAPRTRRGLLLASAPFVSMCPTCKDNRSQLGYSPGALLRRLHGKKSIEAHCVICKGFWPINSQERTRLAREFEHLRLA